MVIAYVTVVTWGGGGLRGAKELEEEQEEEQSRLRMDRPSQLYFFSEGWRLCLAYRGK